MRRNLARAFWLSIALISFGCPDQAAYEGDHSDAGLDAAVDLQRSTQAVEFSVCGDAAGMEAHAPWPMQGGCSTRATRSTAYGAQTNEQNWTAYLSGNVRSSPVVSGSDWIYVGSDAGKLFRLDPASGEIIGSVSVGGPVRGTPAIGRTGTLYVGSDSNRLYAIDPFTLAIKWSYATAGAISSSPAIDGSSVIYVGSEDGSLYAINSDGTKKWSYATAGRITSSPALGLANVYVGGEDKYFYALKNDGSLRWRVPFAQPIVSSPVVGRFGQVYFTVGSDLVALDALTGAMAFTRSMAPCAATTIGANTNGTLYVGRACSTEGALTNGVAQYSGVWAFSPEGALIWTAASKGAVRTIPIVDILGNVFFGDDSGRVNALDNLGRPLWTYLGVGRVVSSPAIARDGAVIVGTNSNQLTSIGEGRPRGGSRDRCVADADCAPGLVCGRGNGPRYAMAASVSACWAPSCENKVQDPGETEIDCGGACGLCTKVCTTSCVLGAQVTPPAQDTLSFSKGAFFRGSYGSHQLGANNVVIVGGNQLRFEDKGDGNGRIALFEGDRTNRLMFSEQMDHAPQWRAPTGSTAIALHADGAVSPDGQPSGDILVAHAGGYPSPTQALATPLRAGVLSAWLRQNYATSYDPAAPKIWTRAVLVDAQSRWYSDPAGWTAPARWERRSMPTAATPGPVELSVSHRAGWPGSASVFPELAAATNVFWGWQLEEAQFASSYIPTVDLSGTRALDRLIFESKDVPSWLVRGTWQLDVLPVFASADIVVGQEFVIVAWEGGQLSLSRDATGGLLKIANGTTSAQRKVEWPRNAKLLLTVNSALNTIDVRGAAQGDGTFSYGTIAVGTGRLAIGSMLDGSRSAFSRLSELRKVSSATVACVPDPDCVRCGDGIVNGSEVCDTGASAWCASNCASAANPVPGSSNADCGPGQVLGENNGERFGYPPNTDVCWPVEPCARAPQLACGLSRAMCGFCLNPPNCAGKRCGDNLSDGAGGTCDVACGARECGCQADSQCPQGHRCLLGQAERFGCAAGQGVCAKDACDDFYGDLSLCGAASSECGSCPPPRPLCAGVECGPDINGLLCPSRCGQNERCADGQCVNDEIQSSRPPEAPPPSPPSTVAQTAKIGTIPGRFEVTPRGTARYAMQLEAPAGYNGVEPKLELAYDSSGGNGYLGLGWTVSGLGLSLIQRCNKNFADDGANSAPNIVQDDAYCLEGKRLTRVGASSSTVEYRTLPDTFSKIVADYPNTFANGPGRFTVYAKGGLIFEYGQERLTCSASVADRPDPDCNNSRIYQDQGDGAKLPSVRAWALSSVRDRAGNTLQVFYAPPGPCTGSGTCGTDEIYPVRMNYTGGGYVDFEYQKTPRPDPVSGYRFGTPTRKSRLLSKIVTGSRDGTYRSYWFDYLSRWPDSSALPAHYARTVEKVEMCAGDAPSRTGLACLPATAFSYGTSPNPKRVGFERASKVQDDLAAPIGRSSLPIALDVDGDGRSELLTASGSGNHVQKQLLRNWGTRLPENTGTFTQKTTLWNPDTDQNHPDRERISFASVYEALDVDQDGRSEILVEKARAGVDRSVWQLMRYSSVEGRFYDYAGFPLLSTWEHEIVMVDVNGDGLVDVLECPNTTTWGAWLQNPLSGGYGARTSIAVTQIPGSAGVMCGRSGPVAGVNLGVAGSVIEDINGDGQRDVLVKSYLESRRTTVGYRMEFRRSSAGQWNATPVEVSTSDAHGRAVVEDLWGDFNGDGYREPLGYLNTGGRFVRLPHLNGMLTGDYENRMVIDYDADGRDDVIVRDHVYRQFVDDNFRTYEPVTDLLVGIDSQWRLGTGDFNGDGVTDLLNTQVVSAVGTDDVYVLLGATPARRLTTVIDGLGNKTEIGYGGQPIAGRLDSCLVPCGRVPSSGHGLVRSSNDREHYYHYQYGGLHRDIQRGEVLGFDMTVRQENMSWSATEFDHRYATGTASLDVPGHGGRFLYASKPGRRTELHVVQGSQLSGAPQEVLAERETLGWLPRSSASGIRFPFSEKTSRSEGSGKPTAPLTRESPYLAVQNAVTSWGLRTELTTQQVDGFGNITLSDRLSSDYTRVRTRRRFFSTLQHRDQWLVGLLEREVASWDTSAPNVRVPEWDYRRTSYEYDARGFLTASTREPAVITWDSEGERTGAAALMETGRALHELRTELAVDTRGRLTERREISGSEMRTDGLVYWPHESLPYPRRAFNALGHLTILSFDRNSGQLRFVQHPDGRRVSNSYDLFGRPTSVSEPEGTTTLTLATAAPSQISVLGEKPIPVPAKYVSTESSPTGQVTSIAFDSLGRPVSRRWKSAMGTVVGDELQYVLGRDLVGRRTKPHLAIAGAQASHTYEYDALDRLRSVLTPSSEGHYVEEYFYAPPELLADTYRTWLVPTNELAARVRSVSLHKNKRGDVDAVLMGLREHPFAVIDAGNTWTMFVPGTFGSTAATVIQPPGGAAVTTRTRHSAYGWLRSKLDPDTGERAYTYSKFGEVKSYTDANGEQFSFTYDSLGRLIRRNNSSEANGFAWQWDCRKAADGSCINPTVPATGKLVWSQSRQGHEVEISYEPMFGNPERETHRIQNGATKDQLDLGYAYNGTGQVQFLSYPSRGDAAPRLVAEYRYTAGQPSSVSLQEGGLTKPIWSRKGEQYGVRESFAYGNNTVSLRELDPRSGDVVRMDEFANATGASLDTLGLGQFDQHLLSRWRLSYDPNGNLLTRSDRVGELVRSKYDARDRLTDEVHERTGQPAAELEHFDYDDLGNLTFKSSVGAYTYDPARPHVVVNAGIDTYSHDNNGNRLSRMSADIVRSSQTLTFDEDDMLTRVVSRSGSAPVTTGYEYNAAGARTVTTTPSARTLHVGKLYERLDQNGSRTHLHRILVDGMPVAEVEVAAAGTTKRYLHLDFRSSPTLVTGANGEVLGKPRFDAFGKSVADASTAKVGFTSHRPVDATGLIDMGGRFYDPSLARFVSADPFVQDFFWSQAYNRYAYVQGNPLSRIDPSGFQSACNDAGADLVCRNSDGTYSDRTGDTVEVTGKRPQDEPTREPDPGPTPPPADTGGPSTDRSTNLIESQRTDSPSSVVGGPVSPGQDLVVDLGRAATRRVYEMELMILDEFRSQAIGAAAGQLFGLGLKYALAARFAAPVAGSAARGAGAVIAEGKFGYLFGQASGRAHNVARAAENAAQMAKVGVHNNGAGRALLQSHFDKVVADPSNVVRTFANEHGSFVVRESLFAGPGGFVKFESTWQVLEGGLNRLTTAIPFGRM